MLLSRSINLLVQLNMTKKEDLSDAFSNYSLVLGNVFENKNTIFSVKKITSTCITIPNYED